MSSVDPVLIPLASRNRSNHGGAGAPGAVSDLGDGETGRTAGRDPVAADGIRAAVRELIDPLNTVVGFSDMLLSGGLSSDERALYTRRVFEAARQLEQRVRLLEVITRDDGQREEQLPLF